MQVDKHGITIYTTYISVDRAHHEIVRAKVGKGGINQYNNQSSSIEWCPETCSCVGHHLVRIQRGGAVGSDPP